MHVTVQLEGIITQMVFDHSLKIRVKEEKDTSDIFLTLCEESIHIYYQTKIKAKPKNPKIRHSKRNNLVVVT